MEVPTGTTGEKGCWDNFESLAENLLYDLADLGVINVHGALYLKPFYVWAKQSDFVRAK